MGKLEHRLDHVLIVDDDPILCAVAESYFKKHGVERVESASNGEQALAILDQASGQPDFLLCDLNMPNMDGIQFLRHLEKRGFPGAIAIVSGEAASVIALAERIAAKHNLNLVGSLAKPLQESNLDGVVAAAAAQSAEMPEAEQLSGNVVGPADLRAAIANGQIVSAYQPKVDVRTRKVTGVEALARWQHPEWGIISPANFIPMAEENGLITGLTGVMLRSAILDVRRWSQMGLDLSCSVNLSANTLDNINFPDEIAACVDAAGLRRTHFVFEVTESCLLKNEATPMEVLARLRILGFDLSIDDFGTGSSNIEQLRDFPFCELKIDKSFVSAMPDQKFARQCVQTSVELARELDLRTVAEGVETAAVREIIAELGIDQMQGYLYSKPVAADDFLSWLKAYSEPGGQASFSAPAPLAEAAATAG